MLVGFVATILAGSVALAVDTPQSASNASMAPESPESPESPGSPGSPGSPERASERDQRIEAIDADMRSRDFERRHQAMLRLWADRETFHTWVESATQDPDPEVARRASWVLNRWRRGLLPDTPADVVAKLESSNGVDTVESLMNAGLFEGALVAIDEAITGAMNSGTIDRARASLHRRFPFYVRIAMQSEQLPQLVEILDRLADDATMALACQQLRALVTGESPLELPTSVALMPEQKQKRLDIVLHAAHGDLATAIQLAQAERNPDLLRVCRMLNGQWDVLAQEQVTAANSQPEGSINWYRHWMYALISATRGNVPAIRQQAVTELSKTREDVIPRNSLDSINRIRWQSLAMHGELDAATEILAQLKPDDAAEVLAQASKFEEAFQVLEVDWRNLDTELFRLVQDAIHGEALRAKENRSDDISAELSKLLTVVRILVLTGRDLLAFETLKAVVKQSPDRSAELSAQDYLMQTRLAVIRTVGRLNRDEWISPLLIGPNDSSLPNQTPFLLAQLLGAESETVTALLEAFTKLYPKQTVSERLTSVVTFLNGEPTTGLEQDRDFNKLYESLSEGKRIVRSSGGGISIASASRLNSDFARLFELHGYPELSKRALIQLAIQGDTEAKLKLAMSELNDGSAASARKIFESIWNTIEKRSQDIASIHLSNSDTLTAMKAIHGEAVAAARLGDDEGAEELRQAIQLMTCTPSASLRSSFAEFLVEQSRNEEAAAITKTLLPIAAFAASDDVEFYALARTYDAAASETAPASATAMLDLAIAGTIETTIYYPVYYVSLPAYLHRRMIRNAITIGDQQAVQKHVDELFRLEPIDVDLGEKVLESMRKAGMKELASEILERIYQAGNAHLDAFPLDIGTANNLAWVLALADHRLEDALRFSTRTVFYEPDSTVYRDTLAEVLYRMGRRDEAIAIEKACLLDDPSEWHIHQQIKRFETGEP